MVDEGMHLRHIFCSLYENNSWSAFLWLRGVSQCFVGEMVALCSFFFLGGVSTVRYKF